MQAPTKPSETFEQSSLDTEPHIFVEEDERQGPRQDASAPQPPPMNFAVQALLQMPMEDLLCHIDLPLDREPVVFDVEPHKYPMQPWLRAAQFLRQAKTPEQVEQAKRHLSQWFNYNLTPETFVAYAEEQKGVRKTLAAARSGNVAHT
jgi:hypothetical protein